MPSFTEIRRHDGFKKGHYIRLGGVFIVTCGMMGEGNYGDPRGGKSDFWAGIEFGKKYTAFIFLEIIRRN